VTQPLGISLPAITAAATALWGGKLCASAPTHERAARHYVAATALIAAWPHLLQAIIDDAYNDGAELPCHVGDWLADRYAPILAALEES
jgi:hypothetical protein